MKEDRQGLKVKLGEAETGNYCKRSMQVALTVRRHL